MVPWRRKDELAGTTRRARILIFLVILGATAGVHAATRDHPPAAAKSANECVVLLHGLARTERSMEKLEAFLSDRGYRVVNHAYPSTEKNISELTRLVFPQVLNQCEQLGARRVHFVTHSMGGILVRVHLSETSIAGLGRVVMLSPPNQGSEVVDRLREFPGFYALNGPAGRQLGTDAASIPSQLGPANFELGIITGNRSINLLLSLLIPGEDDGKVAVERAKLEGMRDFLVLPHSHPFIMRSQAAMRQTAHFLRHGCFYRERAVESAQTPYSEICSKAMF